MENLFGAEYLSQEEQGVYGGKTITPGSNCTTTESSWIDAAGKYCTKKTTTCTKGGITTIDAHTICQ